MKVSVSFLSSKDKSVFLKKINLTDADYIHVDYMDGKFVSNMSLPFKELKKIYKYTSKRLDVHLMSVKPLKMIKKMATLNTEYITFHLELDEDLDKYIDTIHSYGIKAGISIKPNTDISLLEKYLDKIDLVLIMSVEPGRGGQEFLMDTPSRINDLLNLLIKNEKKNIVIEVDGGINNETAKLCSNVDILVSGSYIVNSTDYQVAIDSLR